MEKIYLKLVVSAPLMAFTIRDSIKNGIRQGYIVKTIDLCESVGWKLKENILLATGFTAFTSANKSKGLDIVEEESILIFRRN